MNEASAREVVWVQACETAADVRASWSSQDAAWASRVALESAGAEAPADRFVAERARHAVQRLAPREPALAAALAKRVWRSTWAWLAALVGLGAGLLADAIGSGQRINLLAPPVWGVVLWNLLVYAVLLWGAVRAIALRRRSEPGWLSRGLQRLLGLGRGSKGALAEGSGAALLAQGAAGTASTLSHFTAAWARHSAPLSAARVEGLLHTAAAALGVGLMAGMYLRGLVLDYRAGWESTFLAAGDVHAALSVLFAPAAALSGIGVPDAAALEALRFVPGQSTGGASGAAWIHLYAVTLLLLVVLPRTALALWSGWRARRLSSHFPLKLDDAYFQRLLRHQQGGAARVQVLPYAQAPSAQAEQGLRAVIGRLYGDAAPVHVAPVLAYGGEDDIAGQARVPPGTTLTIALFDLTATPEAENQGRFIELLAAPAGLDGKAEPPGPAVVMMVDEAAFARRFGAATARITQRREAWRQLAEAKGAVPVFVDLSAPDLAAAERALQMALGMPGGAAMAPAAAASAASASQAPRTATTH